VAIPRIGACLMLRFDGGYQEGGWTFPLAAECKSLEDSLACVVFLKQVFAGGRGVYTG